MVETATLDEVKPQLSALCITAPSRDARSSLTSKHPRSSAYASGSSSSSKPYFYERMPKVDWMEKLNLQINNLTGAISTAVKMGVEAASSAAITQFGGVGKTQLMISFAEQSEIDCPGGVFWI